MQVEIVNHNQPSFSEKELSLELVAWQRFYKLDHLNRVGEANAMLHKSMMPTEKRERLYIDSTGRKQKKMKNGDYLYNRCHLIGYHMKIKSQDIYEKQGIMCAIVSHQIFKEKNWLLEVYNWKHKV